MNKIFILRLHTKQTDEYFFIFNNSTLKAIYTDKIKLENDYKQNYNFSIATTKKEINFKLKKVPKNILSTINQCYY